MPPPSFCVAFFVLPYVVPGIVPACFLGSA